ncbi:hypothetical protein SAMN05421812_103267 [Asanoa hainanensis]|uniref:Uncharacterized protein n=1 Tax=Asanoa hainanensis TaxID=560556 RepID=A0A239K1W7_9ACTN|nr:hypothetical protein [Asanoa hainanensis]SNT12356.1 hypothetical protein SAMN05421812_103267 [Asanoa hainanensis]
MSRVSAAGLVLALAAGLALLGVGDPTPTLAAQDAQSGGADTGSAVTVHGRKNGTIEDFSNLAVTVSQTRDLTNQAIEVSWTGGVPSPRTRSLGFDYLQIMQCWGDPDDKHDPDGLAFRETCQFGMNLPSPFTGRSGATSQAANSRSLTLGLANYPLRDPKEVAPAQVDDPKTQDVDERDAPGTLRTDAKMIPFRTVQGVRFRDGSSYKPYRTITNPATGNETEETDLDVLRESFAEPSTNEVPWALTSGDGTGRAVFELQDVGRAPDLGCGAPTVERGGKMVAGPKCSLVIVPRGHNNPYDGVPADPAEGAVHGSPLLPANWVNRIVVPLEFRPVTGLCPLGAAERRTAGSEMVAEAVTAWQPGVCANNGPLIGYSAIGDGEAARQVLLTGVGSPGLVFTADPVVPGLGQPPVVHAPATLSGIELAMNVDANIVDPNQADGKVPPEVLALAGSALKDVKLTPRLIAKLLTQSYRNDAKDPKAFGEKAKNPDSIRDDPEFRVINPIFAWWDRTQSATLDGLMVSLGNSAGSRQVWRWLLADPEAGAFLEGKPDENGIVINRNYLGLINTGLDTFPKADPVCTEVNFENISYPHCTQNLRPYLGSMSEAALQTLRADTKGRLPVFNELTLPPNYDPVPRRAPGYRFAMSITESASAARYGLFPAQLCKPLRDTKKKLLAGVDCRTPTDAALQKAAATAQSSVVPGVKVIDPTVAWKTPGAYPLAMINYAVGNLWEQAEARKDYAALLRQIAGEGQQPGLGRGQLPEGYAPLPQDLRAQTMNAAAQLEIGSPTAPPASALTPPPSVPAGGLPPSLAPVAASPAPPIERASATTPGGPLGMMRNLLVIVLVVGLVGGIVGPILKRMGAGRS